MVDDVGGVYRYLKKQAEEEAKAQEKREKKAAEIRALEARDPFGEDLDPEGAAKIERAKQLDEDDD